MLSSFLSKNIFLVRILPFLALGIVIAFSFPIVELSPFLILLFTSFLAFILTKKGIFVSLFFALLGFFITQDKLTIHTSKPDEKQDIHCATIISTVKQGRKFDVFQIETNTGFRANILKEKNSKKYTRGDKILLTANFKEIVNYSEFNYKRYMKTQYCQYYAVTKNIALISHNNFKNPIIRYSNILHNKLKYRLNNSLLKRKNAIFLSALLIGEKKNIDPSLKEKYINAGVIHVLAISGLHIGIIFLILRFFLLKILRIKEQSTIYIITSLATLWIYAFVCFLPSSVVRACMIISLVLIAQQLRRKVCIYNIIGVTAFLILIIDPTAIFQAGFQLSFTAYTSIIYFYPKIKKLWTPKKWLSMKIWEVICISISAQIGTNPLVALHFGQIANYSIISNLTISFIIPLIIYTSIIWILLPINIITLFLNNIIDKTNSIISLFSELPYTTAFVETNIIETILIYCFIISFFCMIWYKKRKLIWICLSSVILFNLTISIESLMN